MDPTYAQTYRDLYHRHWWWRSRTEFIVKTLRELGLSGANNQILDIGCGDGLFFDRLQEFGNVEGVEPCAELVSSNSPYRDRIHLRPFDRDFQPGKRYSLILMLDVLEHLNDPVSGLVHVLDLLAPGGTVIITVPAFTMLWTNHDVLNHHFTRYTKRSLRKIARQAGLEIHQERYLYHWTFPVKLLERSLEGLLHLKPVPPRIPADIVNNTLFWITRAEQATLSRLSPPFGSSLLVIGGSANFADS